MAKASCDSRSSQIIQPENLSGSNENPSIGEIMANENVAKEAAYILVISISYPVFENGEEMNRSEINNGVAEWRRIEEAAAMAAICEAAKSIIDNQATCWRRRPQRGVPHSIYSDCRRELMKEDCRGRPSWQRKRACQERQGEEKATHLKIFCLSCSPPYLEEEAI